MISIRLFLITFILATFSIQNVFSDVKAVSQATMKKALPVWAEGREKEMNLNLGFRGVFEVKKNQDYTLKITASTLYRVFLNGEFLGYGPARAGHGYFRIDDYDLSGKVKKGENILAVEVAGYNINSFYTIDEPSFLQAELLSGRQVVLATGNNSDFTAFQLNGRLQKVERYSFQRPFTEYYRLSNGFDQWKTSSTVPVESLKLSTCPEVNLLGRNLLMPNFNIVRPVSVYSRGTIQIQKPEKYKKDRSLTNISDKLKGYKESELEIKPSQIIQEITNKTQETIGKPYSKTDIALSENQFCTLEMEINLTGFIGAKISCTEPCTVYFHFDEILTDGDVNSKKRTSAVNNQVVYELKPGEYSLESFEPYTFKYLKVIALKGSCQLQDVYLREYAYPENKLASFTCNNDKLNAIYKAAMQTFRQNAVDVFTDCPSRERAGWLCDSYFTAIMEKDFTGKSDVARNFYENYALQESFAHLPEGMIPMCYPADHYDGAFIPNWSLWFILQVDDYARRGGDPALVARLQPRIEKLLKYFDKFENKDGLLEKLDSWIFVEWSKANDWVQDVNYPTNMLYSAALESAAGLYQNEAWKRKAERVKKEVLKQSFNGTFFVDNAIREKDGTLKITQNTSEVCQYYAFFFNIATPETHPELWNNLITKFGPTRNDAVTYPKVYKANAFIGNYLRLDIISRYGLQNQLLSEIQDYFYKMAQQTGTLWEHMGSQSSCNHGFASYLGHVLYRDMLGINKIDYQTKEVTIRFTNIDLNECEGTIPVDNEAIELKWKKSGNVIRYTIKVPTGYQVKTVNDSSSKLLKME
jgi:alpha-L-rhamnosidase